MLIFFSRLTLVLSLLGYSLSGAMEHCNSLEISNKSADAHPLKVHCGKIIVACDKKIMDYCSAVVVGSQTVLSVCHILHESRKQFPNCSFFFRNYEGLEYPIDPIRALAPPREDLDPNDDLALFYLKEPIPSLPYSIKLATTKPKGKTELFSLTYGWKLTSKDQKYSVDNGDGEKLYHMAGAYESFEKTYLQLLDADRVIRISIEKGNCRELYLGKLESTAQLFLHDSGAPWFQGNEVEGYTLCGISSLVGKVDPNDILLENLSYEGDFTSSGTQHSFKVFSLNNQRRFRNQLTAIWPHAPWIEQFKNKLD